MTVQQQCASESIEQAKEEVVDGAVERPVRLRQAFFEFVPRDRLAP
jgi:hypothetical protein